MSLAYNPLCPVKLMPLSTIDKRIRGVDLKLDPDFQLFLENIDKSKFGITVYISNIKDGMGYSTKPVIAPLIFLHNTNATGGMDGGNCYGSTATSYVSDSADYEKFESWDNLLDLFWSDISYRTKSKLEEVVLHTREWIEYEYYGNSTNYETEVIDLEKLYKVFKAENKLKPVDVSLQTRNGFEDIIKKSDSLFELEAKIKAPSITAKSSASKKLK